MAHCAMQACSERHSRLLFYSLRASDHHKPDDTVGCSCVVVEYQTRNRQVVGSNHTWSTASNLEQVANPLCAQANSASCPQRDGK